MELLLIWRWFADRVTNWWDTLLIGWWADHVCIIPLILINIWWRRHKDIIYRSCFLSAFTFQTSIKPIAHSVILGGERERDVILGGERESERAREREREKREREREREGERGRGRERERERKKKKECETSILILFRTCTLVSDCIAFNPGRLGRTGADGDDHSAPLDRSIV